MADSQHSFRPTMRARLLWLTTAIVIVGCGSDEKGTEPPIFVDQPIYGGIPAEPCQWPTTVLLPNAGCTGTLVHPQIVITAAHCGDKETTISFGESESSIARKVPVDSCKAYQTSGGVATDYAYCKLKMPVLDVPIVPILMGCETSILKAGQKVIVAGFGANSDQPSPNDGYGIKRWVETTINREDTGGGIQVGGNGKSPCFGDSGGPAFVQLADQSWRVFGIDSEGTGNSCAAGDLMAVMHKAVTWIEQQSGVDITPCHDANGTWHPSSACQGFSLAPSGSGRAWSNGCAESVLSGPVSTCGPPFGDGGAQDSGILDASGDGTGPIDGRAGDGPGSGDATGGDGIGPADASGGVDAPSIDARIDADRNDTGSAGRGGGGGSTGGSSGSGGSSATGGAGGGNGGGSGTGGIGGGSGGATAGAAGSRAGAGGGETGGASTSVHARDSAGCSCRIESGFTRRAHGASAFMGLVFGVALRTRRTRGKRR